MNRDGYHLDLKIGRYTAACTWFERIFKHSAVGNAYAPEGLDDARRKVAQQVLTKLCCILIGLPIWAVKRIPCTKTRKLRLKNVSMIWLHE